MDFFVRIANLNIRINSVYPNVYKICKDYLTDNNEPLDIEIRTNDEMILAEAERDPKAYQAIKPQSMESLLVHRLIAEAMLTRDTLLMHGAVIAFNGVSYMFSARSGTGKTTHIQKRLQNAGGAYVVNGDKPLVIVNDEGVFACGTPWCGKENMGTNTVVPLRSIVFMERAAENHIEPVAFKSVLPQLLGQTYIPADADKMKKTLALLLRMKNRVSFFRFRFNNHRSDAFRTSFDALTKQQPV